MKKYIILPLILVVAIAFTACHNQGTTKQRSGELRFSYSGINEEVNKILTRAEDEGDGIFFEDGDEVSVLITSEKNAEKEYEYVYDLASNTFNGKDGGFRFDLDDSPVTKVVAIWPKTDDRGKDDSDTIPADQRNRKIFKVADRMAAISPLTDKVMPTDHPVPLSFVRENVILEFQLAGQYVAGVKIAELLIEIFNKKNVPVAHYGYCDSTSYNSSLILDPNQQIKRDPNTYLGYVTIVDIDDMPDPKKDEFGERHLISAGPNGIDWVFEKGHRYIVTLTPTGHDMVFELSLSTFTTKDGGVAVPFVQPTDLDGNYDLNGYYFVETIDQLIAMSYLIRHYTPGSAIDWTSRKYVIMKSLQDKLRQMYQDDPAKIDELVKRYYPENTPNTIGHGGFTGMIYTGELDGVTGNKTPDLATDLTIDGILLEEDTVGGNNVYFQLIYDPV